MSGFTDGIVEQYLNQDPERRKAYALDPQTHHQTNLLRRTLEATERAMENEGIPAETRARVLRSVVYGDAEPRVTRDQARDLLLARFDPAEFDRPASPVFTEPAGDFSVTDDLKPYAGPVRPDEEPTTDKETRS